MDHLTERQLNLLVATASSSPCQKSKRGAILLSPDGCEFTGMNMRLERTGCDGSRLCRESCGRACVHAEQSAVLAAGWLARGSEVFHLKVVDRQPVPSGDPSCMECAKLMLQAGVHGVWLLGLDGWRRWTAGDFHDETMRNLGIWRG